MNTYLLIGQAVAPLVTGAWAFSAAIVGFGEDFGRNVPDFAGTLFHELRPFFLPAAVGGFVVSAIGSGEVTGWSLFALAANAVCWFVFKDSGGDDDRWKRRRAKVADRVRVDGHRLAVVAGES